jgi:hypothetical protein
MSESEKGNGSGKKGKEPKVKPEVLVWLEPQKLSFRWAGGSAPVMLTVEGDRSYLRVFAAYAFPQNDQTHFIQLFEGKADGSRGDAVGMLRNLSDLSKAGRDAVAECLRRGYLIPRIQRILEVRDRYHLICWRTETDRGPRDFEIDDVYKNINVREKKRVVLTDVNENRYEIPDYHQLDDQSRMLLSQYL